MDLYEGSIELDKLHGGLSVFEFLCTELTVMGQIRILQIYSAHSSKATAGLQHCIMQRRTSKTDIYKFYVVKSIVFNICLNCVVIYKRLHLSSNNRSFAICN